jgi:hypothetical protein
MTNLHTHQSTNQKYTEIVNVYPWEFHENDKYMSIGIHPWYIDEQRLAEDLKTIENFFENNTKTDNKPEKHYEQNASPISVAEESESYYNRFGNVFEPLEDGNYLMQVPIITEYARGGRMAGFSDREYFDELPKHTVVVDKIHRGKYLSFKVLGESMDFDGRDAILDGAIVTGRELKQELWRNSKLHLNKYKDFIIAGVDGICVKRIIEHNVEEGYIVCHSLNPNKAKYKDFTLRIDDIDALFNIIKVENPR